MGLHISNAYRSCTSVWSTYLQYIILLLSYSFKKLFFLIQQGPIRTQHRKVSEKRKKRVAVMAPGGRQSKRVRSLPPAEVVPAGSLRILNRLKTTGAPEQHVPENISPVAANSIGCDIALQA